MAGTGQDHHDGPPSGFSVGTPELHQGRLGSVWGAASAVSAGATVAWLVDLDAGAVLIGEMDGCVTPHHPLTLAAFLLGQKRECELNAGSTQSAELQVFR